MDGKASWRVLRFPMGNRVLMFCDKEDLIDLKPLSFLSPTLTGGLCEDQRFLNQFCYKLYITV